MKMQYNYPQIIMHYHSCMSVPPGT